MAWIWAIVAIAGCLAATAGCGWLSVWVILWRFRQ